MSDEQKNTKEETLNCCEGIPFAEIMQKMMNQQGEGLGFDCSEMMSQMMEKMKTVLLRKVTRSPPKKVSRTPPLEHLQTQH